MYSGEINTLKKVGRFRQRKIFDDSLYDLASNDYLGFADDKKQLKKAMKLMSQYDSIAPKASMLVNGYHPIHKLFEDSMAKLNDFDRGLVVGSGFLANLSLIEALVRKRDILFIDEEYHASGMMAADMLGDRVVKFKHNDAKDLREKLTQYTCKRAIIAIEGIYSMSGEVCNKEIFDVVDEAGALLIVDEAHSSGVLGKHLLGVFEFYDIKPKPNHIKMGTLGKAYGSYGAYILADSSIISYLENRAKPIIYSTAPSVIDIALAYVNMRKIVKYSKKYSKLIKKRKRLAKDIFEIESDSLILALEVVSNIRALEIQDELINKGFLVGSIRQPTVTKPILRIIPRLGVKYKTIKSLYKYLYDNKSRLG